ncbi:T9SS type A sorting domain-containing protein [Psychroserpens sp. S379A]|uniref:T9SS type A sorting domain-containing protein n=1 Tax=Psychroserpens sp. S379A TaxID=3415137 RepID=UPI003C7B0DD3
MKHFFVFSLILLVSMSITAQTQLGSDINGLAIYNALGWSVATSGDGQTIVVGAPNSSINGDSSGQIKVFQFDGTDWVQLGSTFDAYAESDNAGRSVDITDDGLTIVIGIQYSDTFEVTEGSVQVFGFDGNDWIQKGSTLYGSDGFHEFGTNVTISNDGNRITVGAPYFDSATNGSDTGALKIFDYDGSQWNLSFEVEGDTSNDVFGMSVDMSGDGNHVICGAWINEDGTTRVGYAKVYAFDNSTWTQVGATLTGDVPSIFFGASSAISDDGTRIAIGSWGNDDNGNNSGEVEVFELNANSWQPLGLALQGDGGFQRFGWSIDLSGDGSILAVGAPQANYMKLYRFANDNWNQIGNPLTGVNGNDEFGWVVDLTTDGTKVVVGDPSNDNNASYAGFAQVYDITDVLSVSEFEDNTFTVFPNPTNSKLTIQSNVDIHDISIVDINGRILKTFDNLEASQNVNLDVENLSNGIYFLKIQADSKGQVIRFVKN